MLSADKPNGAVEPGVVSALIRGSFLGAYCEYSA